jgi:hypothetical protein
VSSTIVLPTAEATTSTANAAIVEKNFIALRADATKLLRVRPSRRIEE